MLGTALDFSNGSPSPDSVKENGHKGVVRYIGTPGRSKNITKAEYQRYVANNVSVALVYENHAGDANGGSSAGVVAARTARADADNIGWPRFRPIYFAIDSDQVTELDFTECAGYLNGAASVMGGGIDLTGVYGEYDVIERFVGSRARFGWQTAAWSRGKRSGKAALFQRLGQIYVGGIQCDVNEILAGDWGQHNWSRQNFGEELMKTAEPHDLPVASTMQRKVFAVEVGKIGEGTGNSSVIDHMWFIITSADFGDPNGSTEYGVWAGNDAGEGIGFGSGSSASGGKLVKNQWAIFVLKPGTRTVTIQWKNSGQSQAGYSFPMIGQ